MKDIMLRTLKRLIHKVTGHRECFLDRSREYNVWDGYFTRGTNEYLVPVRDEWHIKCSCGMCLRHTHNESEVAIEAQSLPEVWAKVSGVPQDLMESEGYPDVYPEHAEGIVRGMSIDMDRVQELGIKLPEELEN